MTQGQDSDAAAPIPVLPLEYAPPNPGAGRTWRWVSRVCVATAWPVCLVAMGALLAKTESVVITGPVLFTLGLLALLGGVFTRDFVMATIGAAHCFVCVLFVLLVNAFRWSPDEARAPFLVMGSVYSLGVFFPTLFAFARERREGFRAAQR